MRSSEQQYKSLHEARLVLYLEGLMNEKENENIKKKIESWARKRGIKPVTEKIAEYIAAKAKALPKEGLDDSV